jgi:hypothetical protein
MFVGAVVGASVLRVVIVGFGLVVAVRLFIN